MRLMTCLLFITAISFNIHVEANAQPAQHHVGFKSFWVTDSARTYRTEFDGGKTYGASKSPRPVLINLWYPAREGGKSLEHGDYLDIVPTDPNLKPLAAALLDYEHKVIAEEFTGAEPAKASPLQKQLLATAMKRSTGCVRHAAPAPGRFPLVIYHSGAGSSFEDNALLCEELARAGFVVMGSAFQEASGKSFNVDPENAGRDFEFLLRVAAGMENVDVQHVGLVGHSAGAHASLIYAAKPGIAMDAVVSLDTTQDYVTSADSRWALLVTALTNGRDQYKTPTMFVAGPAALFDLADTLEHSERIYLTMPVLTHNEYISQGEIAADIRVELKIKSEEDLKKRATLVAQQGKELRRLVQLYLAAKLKKDQSAWSAIKSLQQSKLGAEPCMEWMPPGKKELGDDAPAGTPRYVYRALKQGGAEAAIQALKKIDMKNSLFNNPFFALQYQYYLAANGKADQARQLFEYYLQQGVDTRSALVAQADMIASIKRYPRFVEGCVRLGQAIAGDDKKVQEMVKRYAVP